LAHAFVYWGFLAFGLVTINHLATPFGVRFLTSDSSFGGFLLWLRRRVGRDGRHLHFGAFCPPLCSGVLVWLGEVKWESGFIAMLILTLMLTYLAGLWIGDENELGQVNLVDAHASLLIFPSADPAHQASAPGAQPRDRIPSSATASSRIPPLNGDEDFGLDTGKDVTRIDALQAFSCVECGRCTEHVRRPTRARF